MGMSVAIQTETLCTPENQKMAMRTQTPQNWRGIWLLSLPKVYLYKVPFYWGLMAGNINSKG